MYLFDSEEDDSKDVFEDEPVKDPKDEKIAEIPPEFGDDEEEEEEDPFDTDDPED